MVADEHHEERLAFEIGERNGFSADVRQLKIWRRRAERQHCGIDSNHGKNLERVWPDVELKPVVYFCTAPKTFCSRSVVRAAGLARIFASSSATILNKPSSALLVT